jgi:hypothetical protein
MNCQVRRQRFTGIALASTAAPILRVQPLLAHSGHSHSTGSQEQQPAEEAGMPHDNAEATTPSESQDSGETETDTANQSQPEAQTDEESPTPTAQETPASEPTTTAKPLLADTTRSQNLSPVPGLGEGILALLVVGPFLLSWLKRSLRK